MIGVAGAGLLTVFFLKEVPLVTHKDESYGLIDNKRQVSDEEKTITGEIVEVNT